MKKSSHKFKTTYLYRRCEVILRKMWEKFEEYCKYIQNIFKRNFEEVEASQLVYFSAQENEIFQNSYVLGIMKWLLCDLYFLLAKQQICNLFYNCKSFYTAGLQNVLQSSWSAGLQINLQLQIVLERRWSAISTMKWCNIWKFILNFKMEKEKCEPQV